MNRLLEYVVIFGVENQAFKKKLKNLKALSTFEEKIQVGYIPSVLHRYPDSEVGRAFPFPPQLCTFAYPSEHVRLVTENPPLKYSSFTLTTTKGKKFYCFCLHKYFLVSGGKKKKLFGKGEKREVFEPCAICILSCHPFHRNFKTMLLSLERFLLSSRKKKFSFQTIKRIYGLFSSPFTNRLKVNIVEKKSILFDLEGRNNFPCLNISYKTFVDTIIPENVVKILEYILNESKIIVLSNDMEKITTIMECIRSFIFPFEFPYIYINYLPSHLYHFLQYPGTFIFGLNHRLFYSKLREGNVEIPKNCAVVNLDTDLISFIPDPKLSNERIKDVIGYKLPKYIRKKLLSDLTKYYAVYRRTPMPEGTINPQKPKNKKNAARLYYYYFHDDSLFEEEMNVRFSRKQFVAPPPSIFERSSPLPSPMKKPGNKPVSGIFGKKSEEVTSETNDDNNDDIFEDEDEQSHALMELRKVFLECFVSIFKAYEVYLMKPRRASSSSSTDSGGPSSLYTVDNLFDREKFVLSFENFGTQSYSLKQFLRRFLKTQMFLTFISQRSPYLRARRISKRNKKKKKKNSQSLSSSPPLNQRKKKQEERGAVELEEEEKKDMKIVDDAFSVKVKKKMRNISNQLLEDRYRQFKCFCFQEVGSGKKVRREMRQIVIEKPVVDIRRRKKNKENDDDDDPQAETSSATSMIIYRIKHAKEKSVVQKIKIIPTELNIHLLVKKEWKQRSRTRDRSNSAHTKEKAISNNINNNRHHDDIDLRKQVCSETFERFPFIIVTRKKRLVMSIDSFEDLTMLYRVIKSRLLDYNTVKRYRELYIEGRSILREDHVNNLKETMKDQNNNEEEEEEEEGEGEEEQFEVKVREANPVVRFLYQRSLKSFETLDFPKNRDLFWGEEEQGGEDGSGGGGGNEEEDDEDDVDWRESLKFKRN